MDLPSMFSVLLHAIKATVQSVTAGLGDFLIVKPANSQPWGSIFDRQLQSSEFKWLHGSEFSEDADRTQL